MNTTKSSIFAFYFLTLNDRVRTMNIVLENITAENIYSKSGMFRIGTDYAPEIKLKNFYFKNVTIDFPIVTLVNATSYYNITVISKFNLMFILLLDFTYEHSEFKGRYIMVFNKPRYLRITQ